MTTYLSLLPEDLETMIWRKVYSDMIQTEKEMIEVMSKIKKQTRFWSLLSKVKVGELNKTNEENATFAEYMKFNNDCQHEMNDERNKHR